MLRYTFSFQTFHLLASFFLLIKILPNYVWHVWPGFIFLRTNLLIKNFPESGNIILGKLSLNMKYKTADTVLLFLIFFSCYQRGRGLQYDGQNEQLLPIYLNKAIQAIAGVGPITPWPLDCKKTMKLSMLHSFPTKTGFPD